MFAQLVMSLVGATKLVNAGRG